MTAQIIQFPLKRPLEQRQLPVDWSDWLRLHYLHMTYDGQYSHEKAFRICQSMLDERQREG